MDTKTDPIYYVKPDGTCILRTFSVRNILCRDADGTRIYHPLLYQDSIEDLGTEYDIKKNRRNGQVVYFRREKKYPDYCPIRLGLRLL